MMYLVVYYEAPRGVLGTKWHEDIVHADEVNAAGPSLGFYIYGKKGEKELVAAYTEWHHFREMLHGNP